MFLDSSHLNSSASYIDKASSHAGYQMEDLNVSFTAAVVRITPTSKQARQRGHVERAAPALEVVLHVSPPLFMLTAASPQPGDL